MIALTRLNGNRFVLNAELIRVVEANPDTVITLINGDHLVVKEPMDEVIRRSVQYRRSLRTMLPEPAISPGAGGLSGEGRAG